MKRNNGSPHKPRIGTYSRHFQSTLGEDSSGNADVDDNENEAAWHYIMSGSSRAGSSHENNRINSSDHVIDMDHDHMVLDYFPERKPEHEEVRNRNDSAYDEQYEVHDSDSPEISPRGHFGCGDDEGESLQGIEVHRPIEMKTFRDHNEMTRTTNDLQYDESIAVENDDDDDYSSGHSRLYGKNVGRFTSMRREEQEDYEPPLNTRFRYTNSQKQVPVDAGLSLFPSHQSSYGTTITKSIKSRDSPPFGFPLDQRKITETTNSLLESRMSLEEGGGCFQNNQNDDSDSLTSSVQNDANPQKKRKKKIKGRI